METLKLSDPQFMRKIEEMVNQLYSMPKPKTGRSVTLHLSPKTAQALECALKNLN